MGHLGPGAAFYTDTVHVKQGDLGSEVLPPGPSNAVWQRGRFDYCDVHSVIDKKFN